MIFSLIICTYKRHRPIIDLLESVRAQTLYPNEILIVDGSPDDLTEQSLQKKNYNNLIYYKVDPKDRGLTRQRNFGIARISPNSEVICFLDDDTVLEPNYFEAVISTYQDYPDALGVGGYIVNDANWSFKGDDKHEVKEFCYDGWCRIDGSRFLLRKKFGLDSDVAPGFFPEFAHGRSIGFLPPSGKVYQTQQLMGGVSSFRSIVFKRFRFSTYFEGYGLYEDADFTLRVSSIGSLYVNTNARLAHYHDAAGRPNKFEYGKMVVRNGWYVWRVKYPKPSLKSKYKWHAITLLLILVRWTNIIDTSKIKRKEAFTEALGRTMGWWSLFFAKPQPKDKIYEN